jgi:hypothetical protein
MMLLSPASAGVPGPKVEERCDQACEWRHASIAADTGRQERASWRKQNAE